jgi:2-deoxy-D-gluconate 3-dehydrogenase
MKEYHEPERKHEFQMGATVGVGSLLSCSKSRSVRGQALEGRTILVTGGSRGIGRGMAEALAGAGADVVVTARSTRDAEEAARQIGGGAIGLAFETTSGAAAIENFAEEVWSRTGGVDVVFNNAGGGKKIAALETSEEALNSMISSNLTGLFLNCQSFGRRMLTRGYGKIINVASELGIRGGASWAAYAASKGGVIALSKSLAWEWAPRITVNVVAPGPFDTPGNAGAFSTPEVLAIVKSHVPLGVVGNPREHLGPLAVLLAGPGSDFMTGAVFRVDGGIGRS